VAKKVRSRPEETEESKFEFPVFDEKGFVHHELDLTYGMAFGVVMAAVAGVLSGVLSLVGGSSVPVVGPIALGLVIIVFSPLLLPRLSPATSSYTKGDWAGVIALEFFAWLGLWFLIAGTFGTH
jgi:hypothetical protein